MATNKKPWYAPRNPVVRSSLQHRGGFHQAKASKQKQPRQRLSSAALFGEYEDWREELAFERSLKDRSDSSSDYFTLRM